MPILLLIGVLLLAITFLTAPAAHAAADPYNTNDLGKVQDFLRQEDEDGKTNAQKLGWDVADEDSWPTGSSSANGVQWTLDNSELRLKEIYIIDSEVHGTLDLSGCTALETLYCSGNQLTELDVSENIALEYLICNSNQLTELDVSDNIYLRWLDCNNNRLTELDVSQNTALTRLWCYDNRLTELDISNNANLVTVHAHGNPLDAVSLTALKAVGCETVSYSEDGYNWCIGNRTTKTLTVKSIGNGYAVPFVSAYSSTVSLYTYPDDGYSFIEWQDAVGLSTPAEMVDILGRSYYSANSTDDTMSITAVFSYDEEEDFPFTDVSETDWFYGAVDFVADYGLFAGVGDNQFAPQANMSRAMFVQVLYNLAQKMGMPSVNQSYSYTFKDVESGVWYTDAVAWGAGTGLVVGYDADTFGTNDDITREQMAIMIIKFADHAGLNLRTDGNTSFSDSGSVSNWAVSYVNRTTAAGIMNGSYGAFNPLGNATRAEVAAVFKNMVEQYV